MSYDISFRVKVEGVDRYFDIGATSANITWNVRDIICKSTGLEWNNEANNGRCVDIIPAIAKGYCELVTHPKKYRKYEAPNGWGTVEGTKAFFQQLLRDWDSFCRDEEEDVINSVTFWIM